MQPTRAYGAAQMRAIDAAAIARAGGDPALLMEAAGAAACAVLRARWPAARRIAVAAGSGNNGGDGWVLARHAAEAGLEVCVVAAGAPRTREAAGARVAALAAGARECALAEARFDAAEVLVDALLGIGCDRAPSGAVLQLIESINAARRPVLALDLPSGLDADRGSAPGAVVAATATVCFIALKRGLLTGIAHDVRGELVLTPLAVDPEAHDAASGERVAVYGVDAPALPPRRPGMHKGEAGHLLVIGGDEGHAGAALLAATAAARSGAGLVTVATRQAHASALVAARPELMPRGCEDAAALARALDGCDACVLGPGLGQGAWGRLAWAAALATATGGVLDADGLNLLAADPRPLGDGWVLTPHPGEAARLLGIDTAAVQADRYACALQLAERHAATVVLKGAGTVVASPAGELAVIDHANPAMASGGMGDALAGVIGALLAQGLDAPAAALAGVRAHARAAQRAAQGRVRGLLAGDVIDALPAALAP